MAPTKSQRDHFRIAYAHGHALCITPQHMLDAYDHIERIEDDRDHINQKLDAEMRVSAGLRECLAVFDPSALRAAIARAEKAERDRDEWIKETKTAQGLYEVCAKDRAAFSDQIAAAMSTDGVERACTVVDRKNDWNDLDEYEKGERRKFIGKVIAAALNAPEVAP